MSFRFFFLLFFFNCSTDYSSAQKTQTQKPNYAVYTQLLQKNISNQGFVNYAAFKKEEKKLDEFLNQISKGIPDPKWTKNDQLAFWINAYNAFTIKLILNYQGKNLKSIKDISNLVSIPKLNSPWDIEFFEIGGKKMDLNDIEHGIIRKNFNEPKIHAALVCASKSCPKLRKEAFEGSKLNEQLDDQMSDFINDKTKNIISTSKLQLSEIFNWYGSDFTKTKPIYLWINQYSAVKSNKNTPIVYLKYDWSLNGSF